MNQAAPPPSFSQPAFVAAARAEFEALRAARPDLEYVDAVLADICGVLRGKRLRIAEAGKLFDSGMQIPHSIYLMDANGEMTNPFGRGYGDGDPDGSAWPIPGTISAVWGPGPARARMLMSLRDGAGHSDPAEPRACLERVLARFEEFGLTPVCALELEFYLVDPKPDMAGAPLPPCNPVTGARDATASVYGIAELDRYAAFLGALAEAARLEGLPLTTTSKEYAPGQFEANLHHQPNAVDAADHAVFLKQAIRSAAQATGFRASFMAKPYPSVIGSGLHIHLSLVDGAGRNIFDNGSPEGAETLRHAIAGLQSTMADAMALFAPNVNSYRRFAPDMFAPVNRRWGINNRSTGLRVPAGPGGGRRVEHRVAGADANPYFALAAMLAGVHHGLTEKRDPGPPSVGNVSHEPDRALPFSLADALGRLGNAKVLETYLGAETLSLFRETKRIESERLAKIISKAEYDWYL